MKNKPGAPASAVPRQSDPPRSIDAPMEARFKSYDDQISNLKTALSDVQKDLKKSTETAEQSALRLDGGINALDSSVKDSLTQLSQSFADSLTKAMARQDNQMTTNFNELKALLEASAAVPSPAKKHMRMDDLWFCFATFSSLCCVPGPLDLFGLFAFLCGTRVGEANNPGPCVDQPCNDRVAARSDNKLRFTVCNPSAIYGKVNDFAELGSHVYFVAETSATLAAQKIFSRECKPLGFTPYFSAPCSVKRDTVLSRPSLRGEAYIWFHDFVFTSF